MSIRILLADDHPVVLEGLAALLDFQPDLEVVHRAFDGTEALAGFRATRPDVAILDLRMPNLDGVATIAAICAEFPAARLCVLTTHDGDEDIFRALEAGALGYLLKDAARDEILAAVRDVAVGRRHVPPDVEAKLAERAAAGPSLSAREREVLEVLALGRSNREIATVLFISEATVKSHVNAILEKLDAADRTEAVTIALRRGILHV